jgi:hypothetical protein
MIARACVTCTNDSTEESCKRCLRDNVAGNGLTQWAMKPSLRTCTTCAYDTCPDYSARRVDCFATDARTEWTVPDATAIVDSPLETGTTAGTRGPLTRDEILDLMPIIQSGWAISDYAEWLARAVERAHGIVMAAPDAPVNAKPAAIGVTTDELLDLLEYVFVKYENGPQCYEDPESYSGYLGHAFHIGDEEFQRIADILNAHRPQTCNTAN